ncbi:ribonuclease P protein component [Candidatus Azambacteria bacterium RIFOXYD1_FULL_42_11]|uniref:Ribonuclease P protein component n=4 Tax=Candidatus Azamiibacteriota TaxID=1752741 RepID=A0A0G1BJ41_9BACT|nr:MAG: Ribonuclease P protein component [Candidatus Azambacteria bacterium GW2011_GWB1_42_17]KKS46296.1 MAG: Ribonuclease P protein component [Candidatus Azambacteria bacterium GW2011_GWA1_42_19]KKS75677.1 MAG: Ribonuclease P protein component [Candidatus Azambacteria bacterium GW2011_GWA2_42_9]KKS88560.1 MAG: Ribonuclease P protein component [Parcubacteria group bacterium GW2011_GWC1_43_11]OGD42963.1 MAG: ribonuclease P protein component [Candidatus Azambacteria bacterium RIFOXYD1_FULL_42_11]
MLPKMHRLKSSRDFNKVFKGGKTADNLFLKIKFLKNRQNVTRFGFIIGIKFSKRAAIRNLIKRRLRAAASSLFKETKPGFDIVIWPKEAVKKETDYQALLIHLKGLLNKNDLLFI